MTKTTTYLLLSLGLVNACGNATQESNVDPPETIENPTNKVMLSSEIEWEQLNPARGDQSPQAGTIWGSRKATIPRAKRGMATGFLAKFVDGFSSPPHIHNVTYRAVVIKGSIHNDDAEAENMWMTPGSFWTQPAGEAHITSAKGAENMALVEIDYGPYLVKPTSEAFDDGERPINIDASNVVWLNNQQTNWIDTKSNAELSFLFDSRQEDERKSLFVKLPPGYSGAIETTGNVLHAVVIKGVLHYTMPQSKEIKALDPGSYFGATDKAVHTLTNASDGQTIVYLRTNGAINVR
ncbi:MAG: DUF4437 domain-containing protein [Bacteroidota bacterium]